MKNFKKFCAAASAFALTAGTLAAFPSSSGQLISADAVYVENSFDAEYEGWCSAGDMTELTADEQNPHNGTRSMFVSGRLSPEDGVSSSKGLWLWGGRKYDYSVFVKHGSGTVENFKVTLTYLLSDEETWETVTLAEKSVADGEWTELAGSCRTPEGASEFIVKITADSTCDFNFDDFTVSGKKYADSTVSAAGGLKDVFGDYFRVGNILNGGTVKNSAITGMYLRDFNAIECENETKPDATLVQNGSTDTNIKVSLNSCAAIADFCSKNGLGFRGHTLVWHSQTPQWFFKENFNANAGWVSQSVMNQRLESYIKNMFNAFKTQYPNLDLYAYDVANECMNDQNGGPRQGGYSNGASPWTQIYGDNSFIEKAFGYARQYAPSTCKLYYNDYNEYMANGKKQAIMALAKDLYGKGLLDGVGMQSHVPANATGFAGTEDYLKAMDDYLAIGCDVQVTELDISLLDNGSPKYSYQDQANKYKAIYQHAVEHNLSNKAGAGKVTLVQVWGPNDANSWLKSGSNALLFDGSNQPKLAYNTLMGMAEDGSIAPPKPPEVDGDGYWFHDTFESGTDSWSARGGCTVETSSASKYAGSKSLSISGREDTWNGGQKSLSTRIFEPGKEYAFSACFTNTTGADAVEFKLTLQYNDASGEAQYDKIAQTSANKGEYVQLYNPNYKIPSGASDLVLVVETTEELCDFYVDEVIGAPAGTKIDGPSSSVVTPTKVKGDLDMDGKITIADLVLMKNGILNGFRSNAEKSNADVDSSSETNASDALNLQKYLLGTLAEFPDNTPAVPSPEPSQEPAKPAFNYNANLTFKEAPGNYLNGCSQSGKLITETYNGINGANKLQVYLPYGYDESKKYNIFYLMHGGGENETTIFSNDVKMGQILDNMIMNGEIEPMIVVAPTFNKCTAQTFYKEWRQSVVPFVEGKYSTYAASTSEADLKASRYHRAYGGFSMGSCSTWANMINNLDLCAYWMPLSGDNWEANDAYGKSKTVANAIDKFGLKPNEYFIMCATGSEDIAYPNMNPQIAEMKKDSHFIYTSDLSKGNFYYLVADGKTHWWGYVRHYVYDMLPSFFHEGN